MKHSLFATLLALTLCYSAVTRADEFDIKRSDHQTHIAASYGIALTSTMIFEKRKFSQWEAIVMGSAVTLAIGLAKEYALDKEASTGDLVADGIGTVLSGLVVFTFDL